MSQSYCRFCIQPYKAWTNFCRPGSAPNSPPQRPLEGKSMSSMLRQVSAKRPAATRSADITRFRKDCPQIGHGWNYAWLCMVNSFWGYLWVSPGYPATFRAMRFSLLAAIIASLVNSFLSWFTLILFHVAQKSLESLQGFSNNNLSLLIIAHFISGYGVVDEGNHLQFLEICAGSHRLTDCALDLGLKAHAMDDPCLHYLESMAIFESWKNAILD